MSNERITRINPKVGDLLIYDDPGDHRESIIFLCIGCNVYNSSQYAEDESQTIASDDYDKYKILLSNSSSSFFQVGKSIFLGKDSYVVHYSKLISDGE